MTMENTLFFAWPSGGTRKCLAESVESFCENFDAYGAAASCLIALDGRQSDLPASVSSRLGTLASSGTRPFFVCDRESRERFIAGLPTSLDAEIARWALIGSRPGQGEGPNRNAIALATAGFPTIEIDDDIFCAPAVSPAVAPGSESVASGECIGSRVPWEIRYFSDQDAAFAYPRSVNLDVADACRRIFTVGETSTASPILACAGSYGDSGYALARASLCLEGKAREAFDEPGYGTICLSRHTARLAAKPCLGDGTHLQGMSLAFAGAAFLPPFLPEGRGEDDFLSFSFRVLHPGELVAYPTFGFLHQPEESRSFTRRDLVRFRPSVAPCMMAVSAACVPPRSITDSASRYETFGSRMRAFAAMRSTDFAEGIHAVIAKNGLAYAEYMEGLLDRYDGQPAAWAMDVRELLDNAYEAIREPALLFGPEGCGYDIAELRSYVDRYGRLVEMWPELWSYARETKQEKDALIRPW